MNKESKKRIEWIDVAKFIGIITIYLGHFGNNAGSLYHFVFVFHVPLFFFLSGCTENFNKEENKKNNIIKIIKTLLIPTYIFSILLIILETINNSYDLNYIKELLLILLKGCIRNQFIGYGIWFLTCLFIIKIFFTFIKKFNKIILLLIALISIIIANYVIVPNPISSPQWYFNIDSAIYYLNYFIVGYLSLPLIGALLKQDTKIKKIIFIVLLILSGIYTIAVYFNFNILSLILSNYMRILISPYIIILFIILISYLFKSVELFKKVGQNTLYLCGNENIIKLIVPLIASLFGLNISLSTPLVTLIYTFILVLCVNYFIIPIEKPFLDKLTRKKTK